MELEKLKRLLGIAGEAQDAVLEFIISDVEETIKNYCNLGEVPEGLRSTSYRMAIDLYRNENIGQEEGAAGSVASISEGDTSTSFHQYADDNFKDTVLKNYRPSLNRYRKVGFS
ncbi:MAG: hypothetical protein HFJ04_01870 [Lachnospiraceae bacterium]|nr:hypothetical protein [Lachnospiraceae bacterium]